MVSRWHDADHLALSHDILAFMWYTYELYISMQDGRKTPRQRAVAGQFGAFFVGTIDIVIWAILVLRLSAKY